MNIDSLEYFLCINKHNSFSLAAEELYISQSSLSKHIKKLEIELNCTLFKRSTKNLCLTNAGVILKEYALSIVKDYNKMILEINKFTSNIPRISIGYIPVIRQYNIASAIGSFKNEFSDLELVLEECEHKKILNLLLNNKIDFAFIRNINLDSNYLDITPLIQDELLLIAPKNHPISNKKYISLSELQNENFICLGKNSGIYELFIDECDKFKFEPNIICYNDRIENILGLVSAGIGISPLMKKTIEGFNKNDVCIILLKEQIQNNLCLVHLKSKTLSNIEESFKNYLVTYNK